MDPKHLEHELKNYKLRQAVLEKKSKFLKEWRQRWVVITQNYLFTFKSSTQLTQPTDILDIRLIDSIKSYVKRGDDRQMGSFKVASEDSAFYFRCKTVTEKWLLEHKNNGSTPYNDYDSIKKGGFISTEQYQTKGWPMLKQQSPGPQIDQAQQQLRRKMQAERLQQQRKAEQARMQEELRLAEQLRLKQQQENRRIQQQEAKANIKPVETVVQNSPTKNNNSAIDSNTRNVSHIKNIFQKKIEQNAAIKLKEQQSNLISSKWSKKQKTGDTENQLINRRNNIISGLFNELKLKNTNSFKHIVEFLVNIGSDKQTGFVSYIIHQSKHNPSKFTFAEIFVQHYTENPTQEEILSMLGFLYIIYFESSSLFSAEQIRQIKKSLLKFLGSGKSEKIRSQALKTIIIIHKASPFAAEEIKQNSNNIKELQTTSKSNETVGTAKKAKQLFGLVY